VPLRVRMDPRDPARVAAARARGAIRIGSNHDEVFGVLGVPTQIQHVINETWFYGYSSVEFDSAGRVTGWSERDRPLPTAG
jgi:hypothetical protein